jgi:hypothetical protein
LKGAYAHALLVDSRDFRQIDVAILSRLPILDVQSHVDDLDPLPDDPKPPGSSPATASRSSSRSEHAD